ncbi:hypothetical protein SAMN06297387_103234 [Streptomyces zhaozhouensis]|uniref:Nitroreductase n=1 Tax=Streptomyces zhaozhouensis TaxID=1300267 RepID=A0A286DSD9_9ACTN|nr:hypothetical protein [Streptomyces zhaozhouensis]SOD61568.1 hypothetical protein SAMN06297387_103234 [Streptomyces zhaozhouensis]
MPLIPEDETERLMPALVGPARRALPATGGRPPAPASVAAAPAATRPLDAVLRERRSVRAFAPRPLAAALLSEVFARARATQTRQWPVARHGDVGLRIVLAAPAVDGLAPGLHRWDHAHGFRPLHAGSGVTRSLCEAYTDAPAFALVCGAPGRTADAAYATLLTRAGALGHAILLSACTHGLLCSPWGGASHQVTGALRASGGAGRHLFTIALGTAGAGPAPGTAEGRAV